MISYHRGSAKDETRHKKKTSEAVSPSQHALYPPFIPEDKPVGVKIRARHNQRTEALSGVSLHVLHGVVAPLSCVRHGFLRHIETSSTVKKARRAENVEKKERLRINKRMDKTDKMNKRTVDLMCVLFCFDLLSSCSSVSSQPHLRYHFFFTNTGGKKRVFTNHEHPRTTRVTEGTPSKTRRRPMTNTVHARCVAS